MPPSLFTPKMLLPLLILALALVGGYGARADAAPAAKRTPHTVLLHWADSTSPVAGYNVYRATKSGGPYKKLNRTPVRTIEYKDSAVKAGRTYFYVVASIDSREVVGPKSSEIRATVPTP